jgi:hypothetical protein
MIALLVSLAAHASCTVRNETELRFVVKSEDGIRTTTNQVLQAHTTRSLEPGTLTFVSGQIALLAPCDGSLRIVSRQGAIGIEGGG